MTIAKRPLGSQGLKVSAQGLGCMGMSSFYNDREHSASEEENVNVVHRALDLGVDFLDSSDAYGPHANEELLGRATKGQPYVVATKFGLVVSEAGISTNNKPEYVRSACEGSLKRLGVKSIDLWYIHRIDPSVDIADTIRAMKELVEEGKVRYIGLSEANASDIRKAHAVHPITAVQLEWSLYTRDAEEEVIPTCRELGIGIVAYAPIGRGMLSGNLKDISQLNDDDFRRTIPRFADDEAFKQNLKQVAKIAELAQDKGCTSAQLALAWVRRDTEDISYTAVMTCTIKDVFPIPGTKRMKYLEENVAAFSIRLTSEELKLLEDTVPASKVVGNRYGEALMGGTHSEYRKQKSVTS